MKKSLINFLSIILCHTCFCYGDGLILPIKLTQNHVQGAKLYASRADLIADITIPKNCTIAEIGVALGDFSEIMIKELKPLKFVAFDLFHLHTFSFRFQTCENLSILKTNANLNGLTHLDFYLNRLTKYETNLVAEPGLSWETLIKYPDHTFDFIYIDAGHDYESVKKDIEVAKMKIKPGGILMFNDYTIVDNITRGYYGVVQAVNELIVNEDYKVIGFALQQAMFCDIAIQKL